MTKEEKIKYWVDLSDRDLQTADTLVNGGHYLWAGFMCHQVIEKIFKGYYSALLDETPPYIHDLRMLAVKADFWKNLSDEQQLQIFELIPLQIEARYPEYKNQLAQALTEQKCKQIFENTRLLLEWTKEKILLEK